VIAELDELCERWIARRSGEGFVICIARNGLVFYHRAFGEAEGAAMTIDTPGYMGSVTKLWTGTLAMMFVEHGLLELDVPIDKYFPPMRQVIVRQPLTLRHLFTHTGDLDGHYGDDLHDLEEIVADRYTRLSIPSHHRYSGTGYALAVKAMEAISGEASPSLFARYLLDPLDCSPHSSIHDTHSIAFGTALDLAKLGQMLLNGGAYGEHRFMSEKSVEAMLPAPLTMILGENTDRRWGIGTWDWPPDHRGFTEDAFGHPGASAYLRADRSNGLVISFISTTNGLRFYAGGSGPQIISTLENNLTE
jgi:CubicO group peptidase (beta-lactamase class C family)